MEFNNLKLSLYKTKLQNINHLTFKQFSMLNNRPKTIIKHHLHNKYNQNIIHKHFNLIHKRLIKTMDFKEKLYHTKIIKFNKIISL